MLDGVGDLFLDKVFFFRSSLFFLEPHLLFILIFGSLFFFFGFTCSSGTLVSFFHLFSPLTSVYDMCKCGGVLRCRVHRPTYPSKSPLFLGSLDTHVNPILHVGNDM
jgi:hypothetical protein